MKRKRVQKTAEGDRDNTVDRPKKRAKIIEVSIIGKEDSIDKEDSIENDSLYNEDFDEISELNLPKLKKEEMTVASIMTTICRLQKEFKIKPDKIKCFFCSEIIDFPEKWKNSKECSNEFMKNTFCCRCIYVLALEKRCKVLEKQYKGKSTN